MTQPRPTGILARSALPSTAVLEMTYACNHECLFCSCPWEDPGNRYPRVEELSISEWKTILDVLTTEHGVARMAFTGGEPTLKKGLPELMRYAASKTAEFIVDDEKGLRKEYKPPELYLITNGQTLNDDWMKLLAELKVPTSISLPGLTTYERHTGHGSAQNALDWMKKLSDAGIHVTVNIAVTRLNLPELYETIGQAFLHGAKFLLMNRFLPGGRGVKYANDLSLTGAQVREAIMIAEEVLETANRPGSLGTEVPKCLVDDLPTKRLAVGTRCSAGRDFFAIDPSGGVRPCNHSPVYLGNWKNLSAILMDPYWKRFITKDFLPADCLKCDLAHHCDGGCREAAHIVGGSLDSPDPVLPGGLDWRKSKVFADERENKNQAQIVQAGVGATQPFSGTNTRPLEREVLSQDGKIVKDPIIEPLNKKRKPGKEDRTKKGERY